MKKKTIRIISKIMCGIILLMFFVARFGLAFRTLEVLFLVRNMILSAIRALVYV